MAHSIVEKSNNGKIDLSQAGKDPVTNGNIVGIDSANGKVEGKKEGESVFKQKIDTKLLVCLTFFVVAASPVGIEPVVAAGGPLLGILGLVIFPFIYSVPMAIMSSEMASIYPQAGGSIQWTQNINHHFGALNSYLHIIYNWIDSSLYPVIIVDYLSYFVPQMMEPGWRFLAGVIIFALVGVLNCFGITVVGKAAIAFTVIILIPFLIFAGLACTEFDIKKWGVVPHEINWVLYISTLFWNMCGYDRISDTAEEVKNPTKTFPKALFITVAIVSLTYLLPVASGIMVDPVYQNWEDGHFVDMASMIPILGGSKWLSILIMLTGALSQFGLLLAAVSCCSRELYSMAEYRHIPGRRHVMKISKKNEPWVAIIIQCIISCPLVIFNFEFLMTLDGVFYGYVLIIEYVSFFYSRYSKVGKQQRQERILEVVTKEIDGEGDDTAPSEDNNEEQDGGQEASDEETTDRSLTSSNNKMLGSQGEEIKQDSQKEENKVDQHSENSKDKDSDTKPKTAQCDNISNFASDSENKTEPTNTTVDEEKSYKELAKKHMFLMPAGTFGVILISATPLLLCVMVIIGNGLLTNVLVLIAITIMYCYYIFSYNYRLRRYGRAQTELIDEIEAQSGSETLMDNSSPLGSVANSLGDN